MSLTPGRGAGNVPADAPVRVEFDRPLSIASVTGRLTVQPAIPGCPLRPAPRADSGAACVIRAVASARGFELDHPRAVFAPSTTYRFTLAAGVADDRGVVSPIDHHWDFTTAGAPVVRALETGDGGDGAPRDALLAVSFSAPMRAETTVPAIRIDPPVEGSVVTRAPEDPSRFILAPGHLLQAGRAYRLTVQGEATDEHGQRIESGVAVSFSVAAALRPGPHAVILARRPGEGPTQVLLADLSSGGRNQPLTAITMLDAPRCGPPECPGRPGGIPRITYRSADLSPVGGRLAVVEGAGDAPGGAVTLRVLDVLHDRVAAVVPGGESPAWSPDGARLGFSVAGQARFLSVLGADATSLPAGPPVTAPPLWSPDGQSAILSTRGADGVPRLELASPTLGARYPLPGLAGPAEDPAISPSGRLVAFRRPTARGGTGMLLDLATARVGAAAAGDLRPLAFIDETTLLAVRDPGSSRPQLVRIALGSGDVTIVPLPEGTALSGLTVAERIGALTLLAEAGEGLTRAYTLTIGGTGLHEVGALSQRGLLPAAISIH